MPVVVISDTGTCTGNTILLESTLTNSAQIGAIPLMYEWKKDGVNLNIDQPSVSITRDGIYGVKAAIGACSTTHDAKVTFYPFPVRFLPSVYKFCDEDKNGVELDAGPGAKYSWVPGGDTTQKITVHTAGTYQVLVKTEHNCPLESATEVRNICPPRLFISNSFSPNKDGQNEYYNVYGAHFTNFQMFIFNRWGEVIFETKERYKVWDGNFREEQMPIGVYPWIITYEGDTQEYKGPYKKEGSVTIVR